MRQRLVWEALGIVVLVALALLWLVLPGAAWLASSVDAVLGFDPLAPVSWDHFVGFALATSLLAGVVHYLERRAQVRGPDLEA